MKHLYKLSSVLLVLGLVILLLLPGAVDRETVTIGWAWVIGAGALAMIGGGVWLVERTFAK